MVTEHSFITKMKSIIQRMRNDARAVQGMGYSTTQMSVYKDTCLGSAIAERALDSLEIEPTDNEGSLYSKLTTELQLKISEMSHYPFPVKDMEGFAVGAIIDFANVVDKLHTTLLMKQQNDGGIVSQ